jgi:hypothetical protein
MTEQELRALVRDVIARTTAAPPDHPGGPAGVAPTSHSSHSQFSLAPADPDGRCVIEPAVACNHCGYCKSYGH